MTLADVQSSELSFIKSHLSDITWIRSYDGNDSGGACLVEYPSGAIVVASCGSLHVGLCKI